MYYLSFLSIITTVLCQSTTTLVSVKKGYFNISPSTTQVTLSLQNGGLSDSNNLYDIENIFGDFSSEENDMASQQALELFSTGAFKFQPFYSMISDIASNVCLMSLSSEEEGANDAVDYNSAVKKVGTLTGLIVADLASASNKNPQTILGLYNAAKSGVPFNTAQLSLPGISTGSNSQIIIQVKLGGYPFNLGVPLHTKSYTKKSQCADISSLATIHTFNIITNPAVRALQQSDTGSNLQLYGNGNGPSRLGSSELSAFAKEVANKASALGPSDIVTKAFSISEMAESFSSRPLPFYSSSPFDSASEKGSKNTEQKMLTSDNAITAPSNSNMAEMNIDANIIQSTPEQSNSGSTQSTGVEKVQANDPSMEQNSLSNTNINTDNSTGAGSNVNDINTIGYSNTNIKPGLIFDTNSDSSSSSASDPGNDSYTNSGIISDTGSGTGTGNGDTSMNVNTNGNINDNESKTITVTDPSTNVRTNPLNQPMLSFIPNLEQNPTFSNRNPRDTMPSNYSPHTFQTNQIRASPKISTNTIRGFLQDNMDKH